MNDRFELIRRSASKVEGMLSEFSMRVMDCLLSFQVESGIKGTVAEFGVYKGQPVALFHCQKEYADSLRLDITHADRQKSIDLPPRP